MRSLMLLLALGFCGVAQASPAPSAWPSIASPPVTGQVPGEPGTFYAAWLSPPNIMNFWVFTAAEALPWITSMAIGTFDPAQANATAAALPASRFTPAEMAIRRTVEVNQGWLIPRALTAIAYKQRQAVDGTTYVAIGSVPIDTVCTLQGQAGDYMPIPRAAVKLASKFDTLPLVAYARCG